MNNEVINSNVTNETEKKVAEGVATDAKPTSTSAAGYQGNAANSKNAKPEFIKFNESGTIRYRGAKESSTVTRFEIDALRPRLSKFDRLCVAVINTDGAILSSQVIFLNKEIKNKLLNASKVADGIAAVLNTRKAMADKKLESLSLVTSPIAITDPVSGVINGCNIIAVTSAM